MLNEESSGSCWPLSTEIPLPSGTDSSDPRLSDEQLIVLHKEGRRIMHYSHGELTGDEDGPHCWRVGLGGEPEGHKLEQGDQRTPEGWYRTSNRSVSSYYAPINIHYPSAEDAEAAFADERITEAQYDSLLAADRSDRMPDESTPLGGLILVHGSPESMPIDPIGSKLDWTEGCAIMENEHIDLLREQLSQDMKTNILILP
jgi:murein L,D-transpeptidase YafK